MLENVNLTHQAEVDSLREQIELLEIENTTHRLKSRRAVSALSDGNECQKRYETLLEWGEEIKKRLCRLAPAVEMESEIVHWVAKHVMSGVQCTTQDEDEDEIEEEGAIEYREEDEIEFEEESDIEHGDENGEADALEDELQDNADLYDQRSVRGSGMMQSSGP